MRFVLAVPMILASLALPAPAAAQRVLLLRPGGDARLVERVGRPALEAVAEALRSRGMEPILPANDAEQELWLQQFYCAEPACPALVLAPRRADVLLALGVWPRARGSREVQLEAQLCFGNNDRRDVRVTIDTTVLAASAVLVDGVARAYQAWAEEHPASERPEAVASIDAPGPTRDRAGEPSSGPPTRTRRRVSGWSYVLGAGFLAGAATPLGLGLAAAVRNGRCVQTDPSGACVGANGAYERYRFGARSAALIGVGAALAVTGVVVLAARPIRLRATTDGRSAQLEVGGSF